MKHACLVLAIALAACGPSSEPVEIPPGDIPFPITRVEATESPTVEAYRFPVSFVRRTRLIRVRREVRSALAREQVAVRTLLAGPTPREIQRGISTAIPAATRLLGIEIFEGVAELDLSREFQAASGSRGFLLRVAQVVTTLTGLGRITAVRFSIDGELRRVPTDRGQTVSRPVTAADYARLSRARR
jgi:hypothetical protein